MASCAPPTEYAYLVAMSVKHGLLALLERGPMYGYQLRVAFEESTGGTWPLNIGQVYTTLSRLERDGLVRPLPENDAGQRPYQITDAGRADRPGARSWWTGPCSAPAAGGRWRPCAGGGSATSSRTSTFSLAWWPP